MVIDGRTVRVDPGVRIRWHQTKNGRVADRMGYENGKRSLREVRFYSREAYASGHWVDSLVSPCTQLARTVTATIFDPETQPVHADWGGEAERVALDALLAVYVDRQRICSHRSSSLCWVSERPPTVGSEAVLRRRLGHTEATLLDVLSAYLTFFLPDMYSEPRSGREQRWTSNRERRALLIERLRGLLPDYVGISDSGVVLPVQQLGTNELLDVPILAGLGDGPWLEVTTSVRQAQTELDAGNHADALTDTSRALEIAFRLAGHGKGTLGDRVKSARQAGMFSGADHRLSRTIEELSHWLNAVRSNSGDVHDNPVEAEQRDAALALRIAISVAAWLHAESSSDDFAETSASEDGEA